MKWFRNKEMLQDILEQNKNELEKYKNVKIVALLKDESNLIQDHLILLDENETLKMNVKDTYDTGQEIICELTQENEKLQKENEDLNAFVNAYANAREELLIKKQNLEKVIDDLKLENSNLKHSIDEKNEIIGDLEEEKKFEYTASFYMSKCEKFEKVIQIIKPLIKVQKSTMLDNVYWAYFGGGFQGIELTKEQYELLKEVLENENN